MAGLFGISVNPKKYRGSFFHDLFWGTFYQQHLGEEYAGLAIFDGKEIKIRTHRGLFRSSFSQNSENIEGTEGIGYCGENREPIFVDSKLGEFAICFSGNLINREVLVERFKAFGHSFAWQGIDIEVIAKLIAQGNEFTDGIRKMNQEIQGAYSLAVLTNEGIYLARSPSGHWPLVIGEKEGAVIVASESAGFVNLGFKLVRHVEPGEIIFLKEGRWRTKAKILSEKVQICSFLWVYLAFPASIIEGISVSLVRKRLGSLLAQKDIQEGFIPDIVTPVPDSGRSHAIGYHQEFCKQMIEGKISKIPFYDELLLKSPYAGRSYLSSRQEARNLEAHIKILPSGEDYKDKVVVVCDDSIVRGTQIQTNLVPKLRTTGVKEIHFRISNPPLLSHCPWGKTTTKKELLTSRIKKLEELTKFLGIDGLKYNTIDDLVNAIGLPREMLCVDCDLPST